MLCSISSSCSQASRSSPAVLPGVGHVSRERPLGDVPAHPAVPVRRQQRPGAHQQTEAVPERVPLLRTVLSEEAVAKSVVAHHILYLGGESSQHDEHAPHRRQSKQIWSNLQSVGAVDGDAAGKGVVDGQLTD